MPQRCRFECSFCGKDFGSDVMGLAVHIGRIHDRSRGGVAGG